MSRRQLKLGLGAAVIIIIAAYWFGLFGNSATDSAFRLSTIRRGDINLTVSASGTVEPEEVIDVGAQVAGQILSFGIGSDGKPIDYGSIVEEGTILAQIDDSLYTADVSLAEAEVRRAQADLDQLSAKLLQAEQDWQRTQKLGSQAALSQSAVDGFRAAYVIAKANVAVGEAAIGQSQVALERARRNLSYCTIKSPVKGVIIDRRVNIGQTVVSSLNAPSLFLLAKDLTRLQIWASVNEADIGSIHPGQQVSFTVATLPNQVLHGTVGKIRLNAAMTQNVVTYTVEILTDNPDRKLLPYLTADVRFEISKREGVLLVPNASLRWTPKPEQILPRYRNVGQQKAGSKKSEEGGSADISKSTISTDSVQKNVNTTVGIVWVIDGRYVRPIYVNVGASDSISTEISEISNPENQSAAKDPNEQELAEGLSIVIGSREQGAGRDQKTNEVSPFAPQVMRGGGRR